MMALAKVFSRPEPFWLYVTTRVVGGTFNVLWVLLGTKLVSFNPITVYAMLGLLLASPVFAIWHLYKIPFKKFYPIVSLILFGYFMGALT